LLPRAPRAKPAQAYARITPVLIHGLHSMRASSSGFACERVPPVNVGEAVGASVGGTVSDHLIRTPDPAVLLSDVKRTKTLPDLAAKTPGVGAPLNSPKSVPVTDMPS
jgi:hypothetical protein